jgi:hypothetical protein
MEFKDRVRAISEFGFTERQARFLVTVMLHSGVCLLRQYSSFAGIVHGQKTRKFFAKLVRLRYASAYPCRHNRGRVFQVHHKALYRAIGETDSRHRRPLSPSRVVHGLMLLDAMLAEPELKWLATDAEKLAHLAALTGTAAGRLPHLSSAAASSEPHFFPDKFPIAVDLKGRVVFLYLATDPEVGRFRAFLQRHFEVLRGLPAWTLRIVVPPWPAHLGDPYVRTAREDLTTVLSPSTLDALQWYFEERRKLADKRYETPDPERFDQGKDAFNTPRYHLLYRRWLTDGDGVFDLVSSGGVSDALARGAGRIECVVLPHQYVHLSPLVTSTVRKPKGAEEGDQTVAPSRPLSSVPAFARLASRAMERTTTNSTRQTPLL